MTTPDFRALALLLPLSMLACDDGGDEPSGDGELRVGLWGESPGGQTYSLHGSFRFDDLYSISTDDVADGTPSFQLDLATGPHTISLEDGWHVMRGEPGQEQVEVDAALDGAYLFEFWIAENQITDVTYVFEIDGDHVPMQSGSVDIDVEFEEDDGICEPNLGSVPAQMYALEPGCSRTSGGWQSFTAPRDGLVTNITLGWYGLGTSGFDLEIREGVGPDGPLLGTVAFGQHETFWDWWTGHSAPVVDVTLYEGQTYTFVAPDAIGWCAGDVLFPGATAEAPNSSRGLWIDAQECH